MQLVNFHYFYNFSRTIQDLHKIQIGGTVIENFGHFYFAESALRELLGNDLLPPQACRERCEKLLELLNNHLQSISPENPGGPRIETLSEWEVMSIHNALRDFETVLESEYRTKPVFALSKKGLYSLEQLAFRGDEMFDESVHRLIPDMREDLRDAGRCIAFEVPTAAAFHLFRSAETAAKAYIISIRKTPVTSREKNFGLGGYKKILDGLGVDKRILSVMEQLVSLHRNPTIHPEVRISKEEVLATLGMVESFIRIVAIDMQRRSETPDTPLDRFLPTVEEIEADSVVRSATEETTIDAAE